MRKFDTKVQHLKYKVLREVARQAWNDTLQDNLLDIPKIIVPGKIPTMRCCVYKERAILAERVKLAMGGNKQNPNVIEVIDIACDECPMGGYEVTNACRGCLAHRCEDVCRFGAITFDENHVAHIDKTKCKECGACSKVCPYSAILNYKRPCETACKVKAIKMGDEKQACIDNDKCISCGGCNTVCPTCSCFDTVDYLNQENSRKGERRRIWSSCMLPDFSRTAGGNIARKKPEQMMRFKTMHKVYDYNARFGGNEHMCVGCGRCDQRCPEDISFSDTINRLSSEVDRLNAGVQE